MQKQILPDALIFPDTIEVFVKSKMRVLKWPYILGNPHLVSKENRKGMFITYLGVNHLYT